MLTFSNVLSLSRASFAFAFLQSNVAIRLVATLLAALTDFLDGFIARKTKTASQFGAILDPLMDRFFIFFASGVFFLEKRLTDMELLAFLSREIAICCFGVYLLCVGGWKKYEWSAIFWGKMTTFAQFVILLGLSCSFVFTGYIYLFFTVMAVFAFFELIFKYRRIFLKEQQQENKKSD